MESKRDEKDSERLRDGMVAVFDRNAKIEAAARTLVRELDFGLDLSDVTVLEQAERNELVGCTRPAQVWRDLKTAVNALEAALNGEEDT